MGEYFLFANYSKLEYIEAFDNQPIKMPNIMNGRVAKLLAVLLAHTDGLNESRRDGFDNDLVGRWTGDKIAMVGDTKTNEHNLVETHFTNITPEEK